jgi:ADP-ribose pyrophosphatase YjhB (NUDIX family)
VVTEKFSPYGADFWKLPGGAVDRNEDFAPAAEREVKEETGVDATFQSLVAFRHMHGFRFGMADIYNICVLTALDDNQVLICASNIIGMNYYSNLIFYIYFHIFFFGVFAALEAASRRNRACKVGSPARGVRLPSPSILVATYQAYG